MLTDEQISACKSRIDPWREVITKDRVGDAAEVSFSVPLISRENAKNWSQVCSNLKLTVEALRRQSNPNWKAIICSQSKPDDISFDDRVIYLPFTEATTGNDKGLKRAAIFEFCRKSYSKDVYLFYLDADDWAHPELVDYMLTTRDPSGYLINRGYLYNTNTCKIAPLRRADRYDIIKQETHYRLDRMIIRLRNAIRSVRGRSLLKNPPRLARMRTFDSKCGSCVAWRYSFDPEKGAGPDVPAFRHIWVGPANDAGLMNLHRVSFDAMLYVVGHGENLEAVEGGLQKKLRYVDEFELSETEAKKVLASFGAI